MDKTVQELLKHPLFSDADTKRISKMLEESYTKKEFSGGDIVLCSEDACESVGFVLSGGVKIFSVDTSRTVMLRKMSAGEIFGIASLFGGDYEISRIISQGKTKIIFISKDVMSSVIMSDPAVNLNFIKLLSHKISFLNKKITYLTAGSPERRLALYLAGVEDRQTFSLEFSMSSLSDMLDIGRASLYRALAKLEEDGVIIHGGKNIKVLDREKMLSLYQ